MRNIIKKILRESEENDFSWTEDILDTQKYREPMLLDEVSRVIFYKPIDLDSEEFMTVTNIIERIWKKNSFLLSKLSNEILNKMDRISSDWFHISDEAFKSGKSSYIMLNHRNKQVIVMGPKSEKEVLEVKLHTTSQGWNGNFWSEEFINRFNRSSRFLK